MTELKDKIRKARNEGKLTQKQLAELTGLTQATITKLETGNTTNPSIDVALKIASALNMDIYSLFGDESIINQVLPNSEVEKLKVLVFHALERYESNEIFFSGMTINEESVDELKKQDEYVNQLHKFKRGIYETLVLVGFCTHEEITEFKNSINPNKK